MIERRLDELARRLAEPETGIFRRAPAAAPTLESAFDGVARALAAPVSRRRALAVAGATVAAASLFRPGRAEADCYPGGPQVCSNTKGMKVCVPNDLQCCSNDNCAIACPYPWRACDRPGNCKDTPALCRDRRASGYDPAKTKFCSQYVPVTNGCVDGGMSLSLRGWCCKPRQSCATEFGKCDCLNECGDECCGSNEDCVGTGLFTKKCMPKCRKGWHHDGADCVCDEGQACGVNCCPDGSVCNGSSCTSPPPPGRLPGIFDGLRGFSDSINQTAASRGGGGQSRDVGVVAAGSPVQGALLALAAVNAQGAAAAISFTDDHVDGAYRRRVNAARPSPPTIQPGTGLSPSAATALQALLAAESTAFAFALACATALARARGALRHNDSRTARQQVRAAAGFANQAASALQRVPSLRATAAAILSSTGTAEVVAGSIDVAKQQARVRAGGVPADLRAALARLGVTGADLARVREALLEDSTGGPTLIAPLADPARTQNLRSMASELAQFSRRARRHPIVHTPGEPKRYRRRSRR